MDNASYRQSESLLRRLEIVFREVLLLLLLLLLPLLLLLHLPPQQKLFYLRLNLKKLAPDHSISHQYQKYVKISFNPAPLLFGVLILTVMFEISSCQYDEILFLWLVHV